MARIRYQRGQLSKCGGSWIGRWREDVIDQAGTVKRIRRSRLIGYVREFPTKKLAQREFDLTLARINAPTYQAGRMETFEMFAERFKAEILPLRKPSTRRVAEWHLRSFLIPTVGKNEIGEIGAHETQRLISGLSGRLAPKTIKNVVGTLSAVLQTAADWNYRVKPLVWRRLVFPQRGERRQARFFTAGQAAAIIETAGIMWPREPWQTFFWLAALTGARAGELLALKVDDVDLEHGTVTIRRSVWYGNVHAPKSAASERVLPIPRTMVERLRGYLLTWQPNEARWLFATCKGNPIPMQHVVQRKLWPVLKHLDLPKCGLHAFRHTHSSLLSWIGAPLTVAREQLGHTDMRLTLGTYSHVVGDEQRHYIEQLAEQLAHSGRNINEQAN